MDEGFVRGFGLGLFVALGVRFLGDWWRSKYVIVKRPKEGIHESDIGAKER